nr:hypothetical protein [Tanacetum cinerariifolium]
MNTNQAQHKALDDALVAPTDCLEFEKPNIRLKTDIKPKEATFQVALDALALTSFYQAFLITAEVPPIYMQEFWATVYVHKSSIRFTINKKKISLDFNSRRNKMFWHTARDDTMFTTMRCISRHEKTQVYGAILPQHLTYTSPKKKLAQATKGTRLNSSAKVAKSNKKKQPAKLPKTKGLVVLSEVVLTEAEQLKLATKKSNTQFYSSHASGSGDGADTQSKDPDEQQQMVFGTNKGAGVRLEEDADEETDLNDDNEETKYDNDGDDLTHPNLSTYKADDEEEEEKIDNEEMSFDQRVSTPPEYELSNEEENKKGDDKDKEGEQVQDEEDDLYKDVNINLERNDDEMTDAQANQDTKDSYVTLTPVPPVAQQHSSSVSSDMVSKFINPSLNTSIDSILNTNIQSHTFVNVLVSIDVETPSSDIKIPQPPIPNIQPLQQTPGIVDNYLSSKMKELVVVVVQLQINQLGEEAQVVNQQFLNQVDSTMKTIIKDSDKDIITSYGDVVTLKRGRDDQDNDEDPFVGLNRRSKKRRSGKEVEPSKEPTHKESKSISSSKSASKSQPKSTGKSAHAKEHDQMDDDLEDQPHQESNTKNNDDECQ